MYRKETGEDRAEYDNAAGGLMAAQPESGREQKAAGNQERKGFRCRVCVGCGLCPGVAAKENRPAEAGAGGPGAVNVLADSIFTGETPGNPAENMRLATADVGTTTVAMLLYGADGTVEDRYLAVNPQTVYGADVISRIQAAEDETKAEDMRRRIRGVLEQGLKHFHKKLGAGVNLRLVLAANTTMTYLLMGWDTSELGRAPFHASRLNAGETEIGGVPCFVFPGLSAFVGGDIVAGMYACGMGERDDVTLLIDLGTNGEIVLGGREKRIACATAAGPAFEGGVNRGVWGADMVSRLAALRRAGLLDETGLLAEKYFRGGVRVGNVHVTQEAVRALQLAKAAIAAGIETLLARYGIEPDQVDRVVLAGGFGYYLKPEDAVQIGLLTEKLAKRAVAGGNTALAGTWKAGLKLIAGQESVSSNAEKRETGGRMTAEGVPEELRELIRGTGVLNLAAEPDFEERYFRAMDL